MTYEEFQTRMHQLIEDDNLEAAENLLSEYAAPIPEELQGQPFRSPVAFKGEAERISTEPEAALAVDAFTAFSRMIRNGRYRRRIRHDPDQLRVLEEGDSWHQYPVLLDDLIDNVAENFAVHSLSAPGDMADEMALSAEHVEAIRRHQPDVFMFSAGGNDVLGQGRFAHLLRPYRDGAEAHDLINAPALDSALAAVERNYGTVLDAAFAARRGLRVFLHGYANAVPRQNGRWLGKPLAAQGIPLSLGQEIVAIVLDRFNAMLARLADRDPRIEHFDLRDEIKPHHAAWKDELHPKDTGFADAAAPMISRLHDLARRLPELRAPATGGEAEALNVTVRDDLAPGGAGSLFRDLAAEARSPAPAAAATCAPDDRHCQDIAEAQAHLEALIRDYHTPDAPELVQARLDYDLDPRVASYEAIIGESDLDESFVLARGKAASRAVARIHARPPQGRAGFGTGFLIGGGLMMTNNHVLQSRETARRSYATFNHEHDVDGTLRIPVQFQITGDVFVTSVSHDYSIVSVSPVATDGTTRLDSFGHIQLLPRSGKALKKEYVNIIQHPGGDYKKVALRNNLVVGRRDQFLYYATDTQKGSSGSPVFNEQWQLAALHHMAIPDPARPGQYKANRGIRISSIMDDIARQRGEGMADADRVDAVLQSLRQENAMVPPAPAPLRANPAPMPPVATDTPGAADGQDWQEGIDIEGEQLRPAELESTPQELSHSAAYWPNASRNAPDTWHLPAELADTAFDLDAGLLQHLVATSHFAPVIAGHGQVIFALRGCRIASGAQRAEDVARIRLIPATVDHENFRCLMGSWDTASGRLSLFTASTVPRRTGMKRYYDKVNFGRGTTNCNMLPTGCYEYCVGTHVSRSRGRVEYVLRQGDGPMPADALTVTTLRTANDLCYGTRDIWDRTKPGGQYPSGLPFLQLLVAGLPDPARHAGRQRREPQHRHRRLAALPAGGGV